MPEEPDMDELARDLYIEICGPIRNLGIPLINLVALCKHKDVYPNLPELVREIVDITAKATAEYQEANDRISEIFNRLPEETLQRFMDYMNRKQDS
jgi:hypothetical protein